MKDNGLSSQWEIVKKIRDKEIGHYEPFMHDGRLFSYDSVVVARYGDRFNVKAAWERTNSRGDIARAAQEIIDKARPHVEAVMNELRRDIVNAIVSDVNIRRLIETLPSSSHEWVDGEIEIAGCKWPDVPMSW